MIQTCHDLHGGKRSQLGQLPGRFFLIMLMCNLCRFPLLLRLKLAGRGRLWRQLQLLTPQFDAAPEARLSVMDSSPHSKSSHYSPRGRSPRPSLSRPRCMKSLLLMEFLLQPLSVDSKKLDVSFRLMLLCYLWMHLWWTHLL